MRDRDAPARVRQRDDRAEAFPGVRELLVNVTALAGRLERVAAQRDHDERWHPLLRRLRIIGSVREAWQANVTPEGARSRGG